MNRSWVRFPQAAQKRPPLQGWTLSSMYEARVECAGERVGYRVRVSRAAGARGCGCPGLVPLSRPGCLVCPWAVARPLAVRAASFARCVVSKPGQALPPPTGTAAWPSGSLRTGAGGVFLYEAFWWRVADVSDPRVAKFPRLVVVRSRFVVVWCSKCRPPRRNTPKMGCCGRGGLRFGHNGVWQGVLFAREPDVASGNPLRRIQTRYSERGRDCPRTH